MSESSLTVGDVVKVLPPFDSVFPDTYEIVGINIDTSAYQILDGRDFNSIYLEKV